MKSKAYKGLPHQDLSENDGTVGPVDQSVGETCVQHFCG